MEPTAPPRCAMLWIGERLGALERACIRTVLAQGHPLTLYSYGSLDGVPEGVEMAEAASILPADAIVTHRSGSVALFSDRFRFELQRLGAGVWLDADVYLLAPLAVPDHEHLFGWSEPGLLGAGVLALPSDSPLIEPVLRLFERPYVPDWLRWPDWLRAHISRLVSGRIDAVDMPWGVAGPLALTALARRHGVLDKALPQHVLYPYGWREANWIFDPTHSIEEFVRPGTAALHLYNFMVSPRKHDAAAPGSFMARIQQEGA